jgi:hypothetical protein
MDDYFVIQSDFDKCTSSRYAQIEEVTKEVNKLLDTHMPLGGIIFDGKYTYQTMIKIK